MEEGKRQLLLDFMDVVNRYRRLLTQQLPREMTQGEFMLLHVIEREQKKQGIRMTELTKLLGSSKSAMSKSIRGLEEKGYVERRADEKDKRNVYICLSKKGSGVFRQSKIQMHQFMFRVIEVLGEKDMKEFIRLMNRFYDIVKEEKEKTKGMDQES